MTRARDLADLLNGGKTIASATISGDLTVANKIQHDGDTDSFIQFDGADSLNISTGGGEKILINNTGMTVNEDSADLDFRVESNGNANMLFVDGGNNAVGIGAAPNTTFGSLLYTQGTPSANKPIFSAYSQGNSNNAGIAILNDSGNRGIWTEGSAMRFTSTYEGNSTTHMNITSSGEVTKPLQPAFLAKPSSNQDDIATGANVTVVLGTEVFDVGSNFASNIFTAPVTGKYLFVFTLYGSQLDGDSSYFEIAIVTSNRGYATIQEPSGSEDVYAGGTVSVVADMDANDTAYARVAIGSGAATFDITTSSNFSGALIC